MDILSGKAIKLSPRTGAGDLRIRKRYLVHTADHAASVYPNRERWIMSSLTHLGDKYAAILVQAGYRPANTLHALSPGGPVLFVKSTAGVSAGPEPVRVLRFSGHDWSVRQFGSDRYGMPHLYKSSNVSVDDNGYLHLRVTQQGTKWTCSEVELPRSLGLGKYKVLLGGIETLGPATVFGMFTKAPNTFRRFF